MCETILADSTPQVQEGIIPIVKIVLLVHEVYGCHGMSVR